MDLVAELVGVTLGPKGRNVVLGNKYGPPKIVNDGETVLKEVKLHYKHCLMFRINGGLWYLKRGKLAALKLSLCVRVRGRAQSQGLIIRSLVLHFCQRLFPSLGLLWLKCKVRHNTYTHTLTWFELLTMHI